MSHLPAGEYLTTPGVLYAWNTRVWTPLNRKQQRAYAKGNMIGIQLFDKWIVIIANIFFTDCSYLLNWVYMFMVIVAKSLNPDWLCTYDCSIPAPLFHHLLPLVLLPSIFPTSELFQWVNFSIRWPNYWASTQIYRLSKFLIKNDLWNLILVQFYMIELSGV